MLFREEIGESITLKFAEAANERRKKGLPIISLGLGEPEFRTPQAIIDATVAVLNKKNSGYSSPMGILPLREKIAQKLTNENGITCDAENIIIAPGAKQAFQLICMVMIQPEDEVIVINPSFVSFIPQLYIAEYNCKVITIDVNKADFTLPIQEIAAKVTPKTKMVIVNSPNNPAGYMLSKEQLTELYQMAEEKDFYILSDEIYEKLVFGESTHFSIGSLEQAPTRVITVNGFSKSHAMTGWRLGYACFPKEFKSNLLKLQQHTNTNTCTFIQEGLSDAFFIDITYLDDYNKKLAARIDAYNQMISRVEGVSGVAPQGGFFAFMNISELGMDSNTFCARLIEETGVATTPGIAFGENWDDHVRISFATHDEHVEKGLGLIEQFLKSLN
jgi:aspartate aminotransferase